MYESFKPIQVILREAGCEVVTGMGGLRKESPLAERKASSWQQ